MMKHTNYVVGFMFDSQMWHVALIRKQKPEFQRGLLNGIGGKVEDGELPLQAMIREFGEEAQYQGVPDWKHFCSMSGMNNDGSSFGIDFFWSFGDLHRLASNEAEQIEVVPVRSVTGLNEKTLGNVPWLVALAYDCGMGVHPPSHVEVAYVPKRKQEAA